MARPRTRNMLVAFRFQLIGDRTPQQLLIKFPAFRRSFYDTIEEFEKYVIDSMSDIIVRRVPIFTGNLYSKITIPPKKRAQFHYEFQVAARYGVFQEIGYDRHYIPIEYIEQHILNPGARGEFVRKPRYFVGVSKFTPFLKPAHIITARKYKNFWKQALKSKFYKGKIKKEIQLFKAM